MMRKRKIKKHVFSKKKISYSIIVLAFIASGVFLCSQLYIGNLIELNSTFQHKAAIIDQLSASMPNQTFVDEAIEIMGEAGFTVNYYSNDIVTVDFYRNLPTHNYDIIILRAHSAVGNRSGSSKFVIFSSEPYSKSKYRYEQLTDRVGEVKVDVGEKSYFGIFPDFVRYSMKGDFHDAVIITMGCGGTIYPDMAKAFINRGALVYFGWNERVDIEHTDKATICLLKHLLLKNETIGEAINNTNEEVGFDPTYGSEFLCYGPPDAINIPIK